MLQEVVDLRAEGDTLYELLQGLKEESWQEMTLFQGWTILDVVMHLHFSDYMALSTMSDKPVFEELLGEAMGAMAEGKGLMSFTREWMGEISSAEMLRRWRDTFLSMCDALGDLEKGARLDWFGPDMGVRMFTTARLMETWAHGQEIYDVLGFERVNTDRIKHIVLLGYKTFGWTYRNRCLTPPSSVPFLSLESPSGETWTWGEPSEIEVITGKAEEFAQVVTQVRNIADTQLQVKGKVATEWMSMAQCFAGLAVDPPAPGTRYRRTQ